MRRFSHGLEQVRDSRLPRNGPKLDRWCAPVSGRMEDKLTKAECETTAVDAAKVARVEAVLLDDQTAQALAATFQALCDPTRVKIIHALTVEELCVHDLAVLLPVSQTAVSHQLRHLRELRLVKYRKKGRLVYYSLDDDHVGHLFSDGLEHVRELKAPAMGQGG